MVLAVALAAGATATAGPIAFVALAAPQLARRLTGSVAVSVLPAALMGAFLLVVSDLVAQRLFAPRRSCRSASSPVWSAGSTWSGCCCPNGRRAEDERATLV